MIERYRKILEEKELDAIFLINLDKRDPHLTRILDLEGVFEYSFLILTGNSIEFYTSKMEYDFAKEQVKFEVKFYEKFKEIFRKLKEFKVVGLNCSLLPYNFVKKCEKYTKVIDISEDLNDILKIKEEWEIERIKEACRIAEKALEKIYSLDVKKLTEKELKAEIEYEILKESELAFETIVAFDENSRFPHYKTGLRNKKPEKVILIDLGAKYKNYVSDITRTFLLDKSLKEIYEKVKEIQEEAIDLVKEGVDFEEIEKKIKQKLDFPHSLGHLLGLEVHEGKPKILKENMVLTIEPGYYKDFGIRIEDVIVVKKDKAKVLTEFTKEEIYLRQQ